MKEKIERRKIADLKVNLFVRAGLNEDRVLFFAALIENNEKLEPILVTEVGTVIDGRHRIEAHVLNNLEEIDCITKKVENEIELIAMAYLANDGGPQPPTQADKEHTILMLLERGATKKSVAELLKLPAGLARRYVNQVQSRASRKKLLEAVDSIREEGFTVPKAAEKYEVDPEKLKEYLATSRKKKADGTSEIQRSLTKRYQSIGISNAHAIKLLMEKFSEGDVSDKQVGKVFEHICNLQTKSTRAISGWHKRFQALKSPAGNETDK